MDYARNPAPGFYRLRVAEVRTETPEAKSFVFEVPADLAERFRAKPGQFLTFRLPVAGETLVRCYSLASSPALAEPPKVTVKRVRDGRASNWLCDHVAAGDWLEVAQPAGLFVPASLDADLLLFAGGSGITPVIAIAKSALAVGRGQVTLLYANRDERSVIFAAELAELARLHPQRFRVIHWLDGVQGITSAEQLASLVAPWRDADAFICGPAPFMAAAEAALAQLAVPAERVHLERFVAGNAPLPVDSSATAAQVEVSLDDEVYAFDWQPGEVLLDAMARAGMKPPSSCRAGACGACMCKVEAGEVTLLGNQILDAAELAEGWILACQARPVSATLRVAFP
ncbi:ferredoxin--NADP reductase [Crenobacter sp. SG2303]|uniref:Ferredoxin--NADP reductase n=1 Tax=Crenobacter oryzisoli TaxID=3056844 RepID=A0ABT7XUQ5_9NEIS|nr:ferredoxin--NADP reductase [Crenobacter sp. SG2303]MDN0077465.1 ferredoxin--NADP reductase [Crenobacter sp. SG2303]